MKATKKIDTFSDYDIALDVLNLEIKGLESLKRNVNETFITFLDFLENAKGRVIVTGMGKSGHIAKKFAATLASTGTPAFYIHPAEAMHGDLGMVTEGDVVVLLSNSGESQELFCIVDYCKR